MHRSIRDTHHRGCVADNVLDEMASRPQKEYRTMRITRRFTQAGTDVFSTIKWTKRSSRINNADGSVVFEMNDAEVPEAWSQLATDIMVSKYFRKAGVPAYKADGTIDTDAPVTGPSVPPNKSLAARLPAGGTGANDTATSTAVLMPMRSKTKSAG